MSLVIHKKVSFDVNQSLIWDLLTNPKKTKQYMFGCEVLSEWKLGSPIIWQGQTKTGESITLVKGEITEIVEGEIVSFTMLDPNIGMKDIPENYAKLTYKLEEKEHQTTLEIIQDFTGTEDGEKRYNESNVGWDMVIGLMKKIIKI